MHRALRLAAASAQQPRAMSGAPHRAAALRALNIHEHVSMGMFNEYNVKVPRHSTATTPAEAKQAFEDFTTSNGKLRDMVIKAQVLTGGRGKGKFKNGFKGGVHVVTSGSETEDFASKMIGQRLITKQTGANGLPCEKVMLMERLYLRREAYFSVIMGPTGPKLIGSPRGGTSIEDVAAETPDLIFQEQVDIMQGLQPEQVARLAKNMGFEGPAAAEAEAMMTNLVKMFLATDATLIEINPMAETPDGQVYACDAKLNFDDNAEFRHPAIFANRDRSQEDPREVEASQYGLNYIGLTGEIGCLVNGAGLAMATMDIVKMHGGAPANFLDVGGGANREQIQKAFELLNNDKSVNAIFVNIFGGIMRCDIVARGIVAAAQNIGLAKPLVIRMSGTNFAEAEKIIQASGYRMIMCSDFDDAASKVVRIADIVKQAASIQVGVSFELPMI